MLALMGLMLGSMVLLLVNHSFGMGEAVAGALYLFSGAIFPLEVLPGWIRWVGFIMPVTYWLELIRRALLPGIAAGFPTLAAFSNLQLLWVMLGLSGFFALAAFLTFNYCDREARERGYIDRTTNY